MYKILVLSEEADSLGWLAKLVCEGCEVKMFTKLASEREAGRGIVTQVKNWESHIKWCDFVICDSNIFGKEAELIRKMNVPVIGPTKETEELETDRAKGLSWLESYGINCGEWTKENLTPDEAIKFAQANPGRWVAKPSCNADKDLTLVSKDTEDLIEFLTANKAKYKGKLILQKFVEGGHEIAVSFIVCGGRILSPLAINFEYKKLYNGDLGCNTGQQGDGIIWTDQTSLMEEVDKLRPYFEESDYSGVWDLAFMATEAELVCMEITPRFGYNTSHDMHENLNCQLSEYLQALATGTLDDVPILEEAACGIVISAAGYPYKESYEIHGKGKYIKKIEEIYSPGMMIYHMEKDDQGIKTSGNYGSILCAIGLGKDIKSATKHAYEIIKSYDLDKNLAYRTDINEKLMKEDLPWFQENGYLT